MEEKMSKEQIKQEKIKSLKSFYENVENKDCFFSHVAEIELIHEKSLSELREKLRSYMNSVYEISNMLSKIE